MSTTGVIDAVSPVGPATSDPYAHVAEIKRLFSSAAHPRPSDILMHSDCVPLLFAEAEPSSPSAEEPAAEVPLKTMAPVMDEEKDLRACVDLELLMHNIL